MRYGKLQCPFWFHKSANKVRGQLEFPETTAGRRWFEETGELSLSGDRDDVPSRDETNAKKRRREGDGNNKMSTYGPGTGNPFEVSKSDNKKVKGEGG